MFAEAYLQCAQELLGSYTLQQPLHLFLKAYFKQHRQFGSRDRKYISELVYAYYRLGKQQTEHSLREQIIRAAWIKSNLPKRFFERMLPELAERFEEPAGEKLRWSAQHEGIQIPVPFALSEQQQSAFFIDLLLGNPRVFIRIRKNKAGIVKALQQAALPYREEHAACISFEPNVKLDDVLTPSDYVVQDISSQKAGEVFQAKKNQAWWDCCAASGGKSILLLDKEPGVKLTVSDIRPAILHNLKMRLHLYHPKQIYRSLCVDLIQHNEQISAGEFDAIICDAPCSGSGTWARTPEQFYFFTEEKLQEFQDRQKRIAGHALEKLKSGGTFYYITCSVFRMENEDLVDYLQTLGCEILQQQLVDSRALGGDCLFVAELRKK